MRETFSTNYIEYTSLVYPISQCQDATNIDLGMNFMGMEVNNKQAEQSYNAAMQNYDIVKTGSTKGLGNSANTLIRSTVSGMVLEMPVEVEKVFC